MSGRAHRRERGVALIIALVVVALATIIATRIGASGARDQRRSATLLAQQQAFQVALGAEAWGAEILYDDKQRAPGVDHYAEIWAQPVDLPIDGGEIRAQLEDMQGRFNLNNLVNPDGTANPIAVDQFTRLLEKLQMEPKWASLVVDWIDPDQNATGADGAEDGVYTSQQPPYRAANRYITSTSELLALPGFGTERYRLLAPYVAALPNGTKLNTCTAPGLVLDALAPGLQAFGQDPKQLQQNRQQDCFPKRDDVVTALQGAGLSADQLAKTRNMLDQTTDWFRATIQVSLGTNQYTLYSLIHRDGGGYARAVLRTFGTE
jgi:general secretion pathway protein K